MIGQFVIVEGVDGSGKTTLCERLAQTYNAEYAHVGPPREYMTPFAEHLEYALLSNDYGRIIFDRFHLGCFAYGPIFRPKKDVEGIGDFYRADWALLERIFYDHCLLVLCDPGWDTVEHNVTQKGGSGPFPEYEQDLKKLHEVHRRFKLAREHSELRSIVYDYTEDVDSWIELTDKIEEVLTWSTPLPV